MSSSRDFKSIIAVLLNVIVGLSQCQSCTHGDIRLQDGPTMFEGRVEICMNEEWNTVCNDFWGHNEAMVVCRQLGLSTSGSETFLDLRITGGPDTGIDDTNCTGMEERLVDCDFSLSVRDCEGEVHKVGLRCHEERLPQNPTLSVGETLLMLNWAHPEEGITEETVQSYTVECMILHDNGQMYTLKQTVSRDTLKVSLPNIALSTGTTRYNCCVEAVFQTYSSKACSVDLPSISINDSEVQSTTKNSVVTDMLEESAIGVCNSSIKLVAGVLGSLTVILLILLLVSVVALVYGCRKLANNKEKDFVSMASDVNMDRVLDNPTYGEGENHSLSKDNLSVNSQINSVPAYEQVYTEGEMELSTAHTTSIQPALYEVPFVENN